MKVSELISLLQQQPPNAIVMMPNGRTPHVIHHEDVVNSIEGREVSPHPGFVSLA